MEILTYLLLLVFLFIVLHLWSEFLARKPLREIILYLSLTGLAIIIINLGLELFFRNNFPFAEYLNKTLLFIAFLCLFTFGKKIIHHCLKLDGTDIGFIPITKEFFTRHWYSVAGFLVIIVIISYFTTSKQKPFFKENYEEVSIIHFKVDGGKTTYSRMSLVDINSDDIVDEMIKGKCTSGVYSFKPDSVKEHLLVKGFEAEYNFAVTDSVDKIPDYLQELFENSK